MISPPIRADDVTRIVAIDDPVLRNLWITQTYTELAAGMGAAVETDDHTWCGFAVWASATAGQSIRGEELPPIIAGLLRDVRHQRHLDDVNRRLRPLQTLRAVPVVGHVHVLRAFAGALGDVSTHIAHGNTLVFAELAPLFFALIDAVGSVDRGQRAALDLDAALQPAATGPVDPDVREAVEWYRRAAATTDRRQRAVAILAGNVLAVSHEQRRLQADIAAALDAGLLSARDVASELLPRWVPRLLARVLGRLARREIERLAQELWEEVTTELLMSLYVPGAKLRLGRDLPPGPGGREFPDDLGELTGAPAAAYDQWDRTGGTGLASGAGDWAVLAERMNYIVNLFRSRQQDPALAARPFSDDQLAAMSAGRVPPGPLLPPH